MATAVQKLIVEVVDARNLLPKDGHGTSSPYVTVDYYGQRKRTQTILRDLNPTWNEVLEFNAGKPSEVFEDILELNVFHDKSHGPTTRTNFLGRLRLSTAQFVKKGEEALIYFTLEKKHLFSWVQGDIGLKVYYADQIIQPPLTDEEKKPEPQPAPTPTPEPTPEPPAPKSNTTENNAADQAEKVDQPPAPSTESPPRTEPPKEEKVEEVAPPQEIPPENSLPPPPPQPTTPKTMQREAELDMMASSVSRPLPKIRTAGININGPRPMTRPFPSLESFSSDMSDMVTSIERSSFDLVEKMHYVFVRIVKARSLPTEGNPIVEISISNYHVRSKPARKTTFFDWDQTFAFSRDSPESSSTLEVSVWDIPNSKPTSDVAISKNFLGGICFDATEIPLRDPPDSPLAPQWYRLEGGGAHCGDLMLATWVGTQADESFADAWKSDISGNPHARAKIYQSPKLWYLRITVIEAQDVLPIMKSFKELSFQVKAQLGPQIQKTKASLTRNSTPLWNEDLIFVAAEPFSEHIVITLEIRHQKGQTTLGTAIIPLTVVERRVDDRKVASRWLSLENIQDEKRRTYNGRVHLRLCFDGGYHVMDEVAHMSSDYRPTARQLWKPPVGTVELGIIRAKNLVPVKTIDGKGCTDAYCVAKYGSKWMRTRTISDSLDPKWNEQYTFKVFDPCTVLTIGVFDSWETSALIEVTDDATHPDYRIGKVRIRISTLATGKVYKNTYPLLVLTPGGMKKMGEVDIAIRFVKVSPTLDLLHVYSQPLLPLMHHIKPLGLAQQDVLRSTTMKIIASHFSRHEPPLRREVVLYMLDADSNVFSMRKVRVNYLRIINVIGNVIDVVNWVDNTRTWKNPTATVLVHALLVMLVWFPELIVPTLAFYVFAVGAWNYRFRSRYPLPHFDPKLSLVESVDRDELDEEFDTLPSCKQPEAIQARYDKLRILGAKVQNGLGDLATQGERLQALVTWCDPRATGIFIGLCFVVAMMLYLIPSKMVAMTFGFYYFRHPIFRDRKPSPALNFFKRLPSLSDRIM
ncbi:hypothetical protein CsatB_008175 [Cannabis sativa]|uniref:C2 domain-containing protein n=2 Tax=Cannabis sativa TaxID=3483 RepID=A0A7J6G2Q0_CANSA|nr:hypothetical protein G4B88_007194 [Cannabis sativa]KAF4377275.1 hypothetical protein F8388_012376 [Cannabis sativa]